MFELSLTITHFHFSRLGVCPQFPAAFARLQWHSAPLVRGITLLLLPSFAHPWISSRQQSKHTVRWLGAEWGCFSAVSLLLLPKYDMESSVRVHLRVAVHRQWQNCQLYSAQTIQGCSFAYSWIMQINTQSPLLTCAADKRTDTSLRCHHNRLWNEMKWTGVFLASFR